MRKIKLHPLASIFLYQPKGKSLRFGLPGESLLPHLVPEGGPVLDAQHAGAKRAGQLVAAAAAGAAGRAGALVGRRSGRRGQLRAHAERAPEQAATATPTAPATVGVVVLVFRLRRHGAEGAQRRRRADGEATAGQTVSRQFCLVAFRALASSGLRGERTHQRD